MNPARSMKRSATRDVRLGLALALALLGCDRAESHGPAPPTPVQAHGGEATAPTAPTPSATVTDDSDAGATTAPVEFEAPRVSDAGATPVAVTDVATPQSAGAREYIACGCGCCGGSETRETRCLYRARGESLDAIIAQDRRARSSPHCAVAGCAMGVRYRYCD